jgi:pyridoxal phosphate enzyme (YggS family)
MATELNSETPDEQERRYRAVRERIRQAALRAGRDPAAIGLLAVSKGHPIQSLAALQRLGQRDFGESYLQEALPKLDALAGRDLSWHFIGPLQANKCRDIAARFDWVHSLDRPQLAERLNRLRPQHLPPLHVCLQVKLSAEPQKSGVQPEDLALLAETVTGLPRLRLRGLMTIPQASHEQSEQRAAYARLRALLNQLRSEGHDLDTLSMGMSEDLEAAILEGSTLVRVGTALFGPRPAART